MLTVTIPLEMAVNSNIFFNLGYIINCSLKVIREVSPPWSKQGCPPGGPLFVWKANSVVAFVS